MFTRLLILMLALQWCQFGQSQQAYNQCPNALELCPNTIYSVDNLSSNVTFCPNCEDDFNFCFATDNTIWFSFTTNATGGNVQVDVSNLVFQANPGQDNELQATIIEAAVPCNSASYVQLGNCVSNAVGNFSLNAAALAPNTTYYVVVDGDNMGAGITSAAECNFDIEVSGVGIDRPVPTAFITASSTSICLNDVVSFTGSVQDCPDSTNFNWYINGVLAASTSTPDFQSSALVDGDIVTFESQCFTQCIEVVSVDSPPVSVYSFLIDAGPDYTISPNDAVTITGVTTAPVHVWSPSYLVGNPNSLSTIATPDETVTLTFTATENGCTLFDYMTITVLSGLDIPNTFSPNGDNLNDNWIIEGLEPYPNNFMKIYSRWGQEVFQASGYSDVRSWDGTIKNGKASEGVYFYVLDLQDAQNQIIKGSITLIR